MSQPAYRPSTGIEVATATILELRNKIDYRDERIRRFHEERNRYIDLLTKIARADGEHCLECHGTMQMLVGIDPDLDGQDIRDLFESDLATFYDNFPDDCTNELCFEGYQIEVAE